MAVSYKGLWKLLIDKDMTKKELSALADISPNTLGRLRKRCHVSTVVLEKICFALDCKVEDIIEITK